MSTARFLVLYVVLLHGALGVAGFAILWPEHRPWVLMLEGGLLLSLCTGVSLVRTLNTPRELVQIGRQWIEDGDLSHSFQPRGTSDLRGLIELYNRMLARLREERTHQVEQDLFLRKVLAASPSGILTTDHDGRIDLVNPAATKLLGVRAGELEGLRPDQHGATIVRLLSETPRASSRMLGRSGQRQLRCTHSSFFDRGFERSFFVIDDLTHELWAAEKHAYDTLIRTLSHEVNNTLGATNSILHSIAEYGAQLREEDRPDFHSALDVAVERAQHLNAFMQRYAEVARLPDPTTTPSDVAQLLERIVRLMEPEARQRRIRIELAASGELPAVELDVVQMEQALINIVRNAVEAIRHDGTITISAGANAEGPHIIVEDSGPGLDPEVRENLFVPFFSSKPRGHGIGLTLVRKILSNHGFDFMLDSPEGGPTRFVIVLEDTGRRTEK